MHLGLTSLLALVAVLTLGCQSKGKVTDAATSATASAHAVEKTATDKAAAVKADATAKTTAGAKLECGNKADKRVLEVRTKDKGCELAYTKNGQEAIIATSQNGSAHCSSKRDTVAEKLKAAGFTCN